MPPACSPRNRKGNKSIMGTARSKQVMINVSLDAFAHMIEYVQHVNTNKETSGNMHTNTLICLQSCIVIQTIRQSLPH